MDGGTVNITGRSLLKFVVFMTALCSCSRGTKELHKEIACDCDSIRISCTLEKMAKMDTSSVAVYATLRIRNTRNHLVRFNLNEISLTISGRLSKGPYIDSFVDYLIRDELLAPETTKFRDVYWVFERTVDFLEIEGAVIGIKPGLTGKVVP